MTTNNGTIYALFTVFASPLPPWMDMRQTGAHSLPAGPICITQNVHYVLAAFGIAPVLHMASFCMFLHNAK